MNTQYFTDRLQWRSWLEMNFEKEKEVWLIFPNKSSGKPRLRYDEAVEEALCFGWIDSVVRPHEKDHVIQRFTPRKNGSPYSQLNIERLRWLLARGWIHSSMESRVNEILEKEFVFPGDLLEIIRNDRLAWENYQSFPEAYKRIRLAYIDGARKRPEEFQRRLNNFMKNTRENKLIGSFGGAEKYY